MTILPLDSSNRGFFCTADGFAAQHIDRQPASIRSAAAAQKTSSSLEAACKLTEHFNDPERR
jgi:hypothetical protein